MNRPTTWSMSRRSAPITDAFNNVSFVLAYTSTSADRDLVERAIAVNQIGTTDCKCAGCAAGRHCGSPAAGCRVNK